MREDGSIQVIPVSEEYRRKYDRVFSKAPLNDDEPCTVERGSVACACCRFNLDGVCTRQVTKENEDDPNE